MILSFDTPELRSLCEDELLAREHFELEAELILSGLADLTSAPSLGELPPGTVDPIAGSVHYFQMEVGSCALVFCANHRDLPMDKDGRLELSKVTRVKVLEIKHHG